MSYLIYINGLGPNYRGENIYEFIFTAVVTYIAFKGLDNYKFIGIGWLLHTFWDIAHHLYGNPIVPFVTNSSGQCAVTDFIIAFWFFFNAPSIYDRFKKPEMKRV